MRRIVMAVATITAAALLTACGGNPKTAKNTQQEAAKPSVKVSQVKREQVAQTVDLTANLKAYKQINIVPAVAARIDKIYVEVGDRVREDQLLVDLDKNQYNQMALQLSNAELSLQRLEPVREVGGVSQQQIDELETNINVMKETVDNLKKNLGFRSPINGVVTGRYSEEGDMYSMTPTGILQVMQIDKLKAYVGVSEMHFNDVYMDMPVKVVTDVYPGEEFYGNVTRINPAINPATRTFEVEVTIPNKSEVLRPGMYARTTFNMGEVEGITVEDMAVQRLAGTNDKYVYVVKNGVAERRNVTIGRQAGDRIEILSGLNEGDMVAVAGMSRLTNGTAVNIIN